MEANDHSTGPLCSFGLGCQRSVCAVDHHQSRNYPLPVPWGRKPWQTLSAERPQLPPQYRLASGLVSGSGFQGPCIFLQSFASNSWISPSAPTQSMVSLRVLSMSDCSLEMTPCTAQSEDSLFASSERMLQISALVSSRRDEMSFLISWSRPAISDFNFTVHFLFPENAAYTELWQTFLNLLALNWLIYHQPIPKSDQFCDSSDLW